MLKISYGKVDYLMKYRNATNIQSIYLPLILCPVFLPLSGFSVFRDAGFFCKNFARFWDNMEKSQY